MSDPGNPEQPRGRVPWRNRNTPFPGLPRTPLRWNFPPMDPRTVLPRPRRWGRSPALLLVLASACTPAPPGGSGEAGTHPPAILVSIDALNEAILRRTLDPEQAPTFHQLFDAGACAAYAETAFPSVTSASHAVLWTGAYGDVTGVTANLQHALPRDRHTVLDMVRGFSWEVLAAEPLWITAGREGMSVVGHHVTQGPWVPGYPPVEGERTPEQEARRAESERILSLPHVNVLNGYNSMPQPQRVLGAADVTWTEPGEWEGLDALGSSVPPRTFRFDVAGTPVHGVLHGVGEVGPGYTSVTVARSPDPRGGITAHAVPLESAPPAGRPLARHFSDGLEIPLQRGANDPWERASLFLHLRLFEVAPDGSDFMLYHPHMPVADGNRPDLMDGYGGAAGGWSANSGLPLWERGALGATFLLGGDGTAEARYLETAEFLTRQFMRGSEWLWRTFQPQVQMDYFPESDAIDHALLGLLEAGWPGYDPELAEQAAGLRARVWALVDLRLAHLLELAQERNGALFVTGDHGMRTSWNQFLPNVALREAGLLVVDESGDIDLSRTRAVSPNGYWIKVNRTAWREGIVPPEEEAAVIAAARAALEGVRGPDGAPVVTRIFVPSEDRALGLGGVAGGDLYWATAPGYNSGSGHRADRSAGPDRLRAGHGFPPDEPDMHTVFCALGEGFTPARIHGVRTQVIAPTVAEYVGSPPPADATGASVLAALQSGNTEP